MILRKIASNILSIPTFLVAFIFTLLQIVQHFTTKTLTNYFKKGFALHIQESAGTINVVFVLEKIISYYQPWYVFLVFGLQIFLWMFGFGVLNRYTGKKKYSIILPASSYIITVISILILVWTMRFYIFG